MTTFVCRGLLNPPSGNDDGYSMGAMSRHLDSSMVLELVDVDTAIEVSMPTDFAIDVIAGGTLNNINVVLTMPRHTVSNEGASFYSETAGTVEGDVGADNPGWTINYTNDASNHFLTFSRATLAAGTHTINVTGDIDAIPLSPIFSWGDITTHTISVAGSATEVPAATGDSENVVVSEAWAMDATAGWAVPADTSEWTLFNLYYGLGMADPGSIWLCQEASSDLADSGIDNRTLVAAGTAASYQQSHAGIARLGVQFSDNATTAFAAAVPNINANSILVLAYVALTGTPGADRNILSFVPSANAPVILATATPRIKFSGNTGVTGSVDPSTTIHRILMRINIDLTENDFRSDFENITDTWNASYAGTSLTFGDLSDGNNAAPMKLFYAAMWTGAAAEISSATADALITALG
jgi:hypothetical protein